MKSLFGFSAILFLLFIGVSCSNDDDDPVPTPTPTIVTFNATLNGANEVPANDSDATGTATLTYNKTTKIFAIGVIYTGLTPIMGHVHVGAVGVNGPALFTFTDLMSPISYVSPVLTAAQEADLLANKYYVNLHTEAIQSGEIRGQLITTNPGGSGGGGGGGGY